MDNNSSFFDVNRNDKFSCLRGIDLQNLLLEIDNYYLEYRTSLNLSDNVSFGVEVEYEGNIRNSVEYYIKNNFKDWKTTIDASLNSGGEIISPILYDNSVTWVQLKKICNYLKKKGAIMDNKAAGHIHIGAHILGSDVDRWRKFLKVYTAYESIIFRFAYGDKLNARCSISKYALPISDYLHMIMKNINQIYSFYDLKILFPDDSKYQAVNFEHIRNFIDNITYRNTLEFRSPNATFEEVIWQNNVNMFCKLILSPNLSNFDEEFLDYKLFNEWNIFDEHSIYYSGISLKDALEFVDLIFDNNLDKVYFLRQYFKSFEQCYDSEVTVKAKRFVK